MEWNDETIARLRAFWAEGLSTAEIGRRMGVSKNAVVGKAHRLNLPARYFVFNGRLEKKKNLLYLLEGFARYRQSGGDAGLVLVGAPGVGWDEIQLWLEHHHDVRAELAHERNEAQDRRRP